jgi:hypothetical protein
MMPSVGWQALRQHRDNRQDSVGIADLLAIHRDSGRIDLLQGHAESHK